MPFHRLTTPSYFGGLPVGYDYLNTPSDPSVGGTGVPTPMSNKKTGGPNDGTYFVAFGEDARATFANRGLKALGENADFIDDILRASIPKISFVEATAVGAVSTVNLVGEIFVGDFGMANNGTNRNQLVHVTDQATNDDLEVSGTKIVATLIHDGASNNVVGTVAGGFRTNASVNFSPPIPDGTNYRVWFGIRSSFTEIANTEKGAYFRYIMRIMEHVPGSMRSQLRQLHSEASVNQGYLDPWDSTIRSLASAGLNERYRRATLQPAGFVTGDYNVAGSGRVINRDGGAVEVRIPEIDVASVQYPDPQMAALRIVSGITARTLTGFQSSTGIGGDIGYLHESEGFARSSTNEAVRAAYSGPALLDVMPRDIRAATVSGDAVLTFISPTATGLVNPDSINDSNNRRTIECAAGQFFHTGSATAIRLGVDLIEVVYSGRAPETYLIDAFVSATRIRVRRLNSSIANVFPATSASCTIRWLSTNFLFGGSGLSGFSGDPPWLGRRFAVYQPPPLTVDTDDASEIYATPPAFFAALNTNETSNAYTAMGWGAADPATLGTSVIAGRLRGDGSIDCTAIRPTTLTASGAGTIGGTFGVTGLLSANGGAAVTGALTVSTTITAQDVTFDDQVVSTHRELRPERYFHLREDWLRFTQNASPAIIWATTSTWSYNEIADTFTLNNGTPAAKNPGQLEVIGSGGAVSRSLSIRPTSQFPFSFSSILTTTVIAEVTEDAANTTAAMLIGFVDNTTLFFSANDALALLYNAASADWTLVHRVGGVNGPQNGAVLGAHVDGQFVVVRFLKIANGDVQIYFNEVVIVTVAVADLPTGLGTFNMLFAQDAGDANATTFTVDLIDFVVDTGSDRSGA